MDIRIEAGKYWGKVNLPPSKYEMQCKIIIGTLAKAGRIDGSDDCDDTKVTFDASYPLVRKYLEGKEPEYRPMRFGNNAGSLPMLLPLCGVNEKKYRIECSYPIPEGIKKDLSSHGLVFENEDMPLLVSGLLQSGDYTVFADLGTDYICGLLMALPIIPGNSTLKITGEPAEKNKIIICLKALKDFDIHVDEGEGCWMIEGGQTPRLPEPPKRAYEYVNPNYKHKFKKHQNPTSPGLGIKCEKDWAIAANYMVANLFGSDVQMDGLDENSPQPERMITESIEHLGGEIRLESTSGLLPILAVAACGRNDATSIQCSDSERMSRTLNMILALGGKAEIKDDVLTVHGSGRLAGGTVDPQGDDRIAMAASIAAQICEASVSILGADCVGRSCLNFFIDGTWLGAKMYYGV